MLQHGAFSSFMMIFVLDTAGWLVLPTNMLVGL